MSAALRELLERACEAYLYSQMRDDRFTAADWMADAFNAAGIPALLAEVERMRASEEKAHIVAMNQATRASNAEAALLAKSAAYEALVAEIEAAPVVPAGSWVRNYMATVNRIPHGSRVRLLLVREGGDHA